jgi:hypothetical protein
MSKNSIQKHEISQLKYEISLLWEDLDFFKSRKISNKEVNCKELKWLKKRYT